MDNQRQMHEENVSLAYTARFTSTPAPTANPSGDKGTSPNNTIPAPGKDTVNLKRKYPCNHGHMFAGHTCRSTVPKLIGTCIPNQMVRSTLKDSTEKLAVQPAAQGRPRQNGSILNYMKQSSDTTRTYPVTMFVYDLWVTVNNNTNVCRWDDTGMSVIVDMIQFELQILKTYNKPRALHRTQLDKFEKFHKELLVHNFIQVSSGRDNRLSSILHVDRLLSSKPSLVAYHHPYFQRSRPDLLYRVRSQNISNEPWSDPVSTRNLFLIHHGKEMVGFIPTADDANLKRKSSESPATTGTKRLMSHSPETSLNQADKTQSTSNTVATPTTEILPNVSKTATKSVPDKKPAVVYIPHYISRKGGKSLICQSQQGIRPAVTQSTSPTADNVNRQKDEHPCPCVNSNKATIELSPVATTCTIGTNTDPLTTISRSVQTWPEDFPSSETSLSSTSPHSTDEYSASTSFISITSSCESDEYIPGYHSSPSSPFTESDYSSDQEIEIEIERESSENIFELVVKKFGHGPEGEESAKTTCRVWADKSVPLHLNPVVQMNRLDKQ